jgi:sterol desaturase/sphingolipid hydroxylase (fatty acid hydroxylase superfamily)
MDLQRWLTSHGEASQYIAYFGVLAAMIAWERARGLPQRARRVARFRVNFVLTAVNVLVLGALPVSFMAASEYAASRGVGLMNTVSWSPLPVLLAGLLGRGFISWVTHLLMHKVPLLWRVHRVHHTDVELDVSTTVRFHPLEFPIGLAIGLPLVAALGLPGWVLLAYEILDAAVTVFSHGNVALPAWLERALRYVLVTPSLHRIHHSVDPEETDSNFGAVFPIWDVVFGTFRTRARSTLPQMDLGVSDVRDARSWSIGWLFVVPFLGSLRAEHSSRAPARVGGDAP